MSLSELLENCKAGDDRAIRELVRRYQRRVTDLAASLLKDDDLAQDAVQEAFLSALERLGDLRDPEAFGGTLRAVSGQMLLHKSDGSGRVPAYGVLVPDEEMRTAITEGRDILARRNPLPEGCRLLKDEIIRLRDQGVINPETAERALGTM